MSDTKTKTKADETKKDDDSFSMGKLHELMKGLKSLTETVEAGFTDIRSDLGNVKGNLTKITNRVKDLETKSAVSADAKEAASGFVATASAGIDRDTMKKAFLERIAELASALFDQTEREGLINLGTTLDSALQVLGYSNVAENPEHQLNRLLPILQSAVANNQKPEPRRRLLGFIPMPRRRAKN